MIRWHAMDVAWRSIAAKPWSWLLLVSLALNCAAALWRLVTSQLAVPPTELGLGSAVLWGFWQLSISSPLRSRLRYSPEWGYVSFFVPIVNLVVPYLAMRDLFFVRVRDAQRQQLWVVMWWLTYVATWIPVAIKIATKDDNGFVVPPFLLEILRAAASLCALRIVQLISTSET